VGTRHRTAGAGGRNCPTWLRRQPGPHRRGRNRLRPMGAQRSGGPVPREPTEESVVGQPPTNRTGERTVEKTNTSRFAGRFCATPVAGVDYKNIIWDRRTGAAVAIDVLDSQVNRVIEWKEVFGPNSFPPPME